MSFHFARALLVIYTSLLFITPLLMYHRTSELFEFNKMLFIYLCAAVLGFIGLLQVVRDRCIIIKKTPLDLPIFAFLLSGILSTLFSIDSHTSIFGYYGRFNGGLLSTLVYILLFYGLVTVIYSSIDRIKETIARVERLIFVSLVSSVAVITWGLPGRFGMDLSCFLFTGQLNNNCWTTQFDPVARMFSTLGQPNWLGAYLAVNFMFGLYFFFKQTLSSLPGGGFSRGVFLSLLYLGLNFSTILFTRSRSAFLAIFIGLLFFALFLLTQKRHRETVLKRLLTRRMASLFIVLVVVMLLFKTGIPRIDNLLRLSFLNPGKKIVQNTGEKVNQVTDSLSIRRVVWKGAVHLGFDQPFLGSGPETFGYAYYRVRPVAHNLTSEWDYVYNRAHNEFLNFFATQGFSGLATYILLIIAVYWGAIGVVKEKSPEDNWGKTLLILSLLSAFTTIHVTNFFGFSTTTISLFFFLIPAMIFSLSKQDGLIRIDISKRLPLNPLILYCPPVAFFLLAIYFVVTYFLADINYALGDGFAKAQDFGRSRLYLEQALKMRYEHVYADKLSNTLANLAFIKAVNSDNQNVKKNEETEVAVNQLYRLSEEHNERSIRSSVQNVLYYKTRAKNNFIYYQLTDSQEFFDKATLALQQAQKLAPTDPKLYYSQALFEYLKIENEPVGNVPKSQLDKLIRLVNKSIALKPDYRDGYYLKGLILKKMGRSTEASAVFQFVITRLNSKDIEAKRELRQLQSN